jgi:hypothetical protein
MISKKRIKSRQICPKCTVLRESCVRLTRVRAVLMLPGGAAASSTAVRVDAAYSVLSDKPTNRVPAPRRPPTADHAVRPPHHPWVTVASSRRPPRRDPAAPAQLFGVPATTDGHGAAAPPVGHAGPSCGRGGAARQWPKRVSCIDRLCWYGTPSER